MVEAERRLVKRKLTLTSPIESAARRMAARAPSAGSTCSPLRRNKVIWRLPADPAHSKEGFRCRQTRTVVHRRTNRTPLHTMATRSTAEDKLTSVRCVRKLRLVRFQRGIRAEIPVALKIRVRLAFPFVPFKVRRWQPQAWLNTCNASSKIELHAKTSAGENVSRADEWMACGA